MSVGGWGELIKQGFQNFRNGLNTLSYGLGNAGQIYGGVGGTGFQPIQTQQQPLQTNFSGGLSTPSLSEMFKPQESKNNYGAIGQAISKQAPDANSSIYEYLMMR